MDEVNARVAERRALKESWRLVSFNTIYSNIGKRESKSIHSVRKTKQNLPTAFYGFVFQRFVSR